MLEIFESFALCFGVLRGFCLTALDGGKLQMLSKLANFKQKLNLIVEFLAGAALGALGRTAKDFLIVQIAFFLAVKVASV